MSRFWSSPLSSRGCPGTAPRCAARCRPPASLVKVVLARVGRPSRAAFPVAGAKADAGWNGFLWPLGRARRQRVADAQHAGVLAASFHTCRGAHAAVPPGIARFYDAAQCRLLGIVSGHVAHAGVCPALAPRSEWLHHDGRNENRKKPRRANLSGIRAYKLCAS